MSTAPSCSCGWNPHDEPTVGHCHLCHDGITLAEALDHVRVMHPDQYGDGPERWPDGHVVVHDDTLTPEDFR